MMITKRGRMVKRIVRNKIKIRTHIFMVNKKYAKYFVKSIQKHFDQN